MNRREFIFGACALPLCQDSIFANRGRFERFNTAYAHIHLGIAKPFSLLHISDTHFTAVNPDEHEAKRKLGIRRTATFGGRQEQSFADTLAWAKENCDFVLHTGDLIDFQSEANFALVKKYLGSYDAIGCMGNHEFQTGMYYAGVKNGVDEAYNDLSRDTLASRMPFDTTFSSKVVNDVNFVMITNVYGYITETIVEKFKGEVKKGLPIILCMHVPFFTDSILCCKTKFWSTPTKYGSLKSKTHGDLIRQRGAVTAAFIDYLKGEQLLRGILSGHLHFAFEERFSPTAMQYIAPANFNFAAREVIID